MKIKTQFWETVNTEKIAKLLQYMLIIFAVNLIMGIIAENWFSVVMNAVPVGLLTVIQISYNKLRS